MNQSTIVFLINDRAGIPRPRDPQPVRQDLPAPDYIMAPTLRLECVLKGPS